MVSKPGDAVPGCAAFTYCGLWRSVGVCVNRSFIKTNDPTAAELVELIIAVIAQPSYPNVYDLIIQSV